MRKICSLARRRTTRCHPSRRAAVSVVVHCTRQFHEGAEVATLEKARWRQRRQQRDEELRGLALAARQAIEALARRLTDPN